MISPMFQPYKMSVKVRIYHDKRIYFLIEFSILFLSAKVSHNPRQKSPQSHIRRGHGQHTVVVGEPRAVEAVHGVLDVLPDQHEGEVEHRRPRLVLGQDPPLPKILLQSLQNLVLVDL